MAYYRLEVRVRLASRDSVVYDEWVPAGAQVEPPVREVEEINSTYRLRFSGWRGAGCPQSLVFVATTPLTCEAAYVAEYRVEVYDPLGRYGASGWYTDFTQSVPKEVFYNATVKYVLASTDCPHYERGLFIEIKTTGPVSCRLNWKSLFLVKLSGGEGARAEWEGWAEAGSKVYLRRGGAAEAGPQYLQLPDVVEGERARYVLKGWTCGPDEVVVSSPLSCTAQWDAQYKVRVHVYLDGSLVATRTVWGRGPVTLRAQDFKPQDSPPFYFVKFDGWSGGAGDVLTLNIDGPVDVEARWRRDYTPVYLLTGAVAGAAVAAGAYVWKKRKPIRVKVIKEKVSEEKEGEETKTR